MHKLYQLYSLLFMTYRIYFVCFSLCSARAACRFSIDTVCRGHCIVNTHSKWNQISSKLMLIRLKDTISCKIVLGIVWNNAIIWHDAHTITNTNLKMWRWQMGRCLVCMLVRLLLWMPSSSMRCLSFFYSFSPPFNTYHSRCIVLYYNDVQNIAAKNFH